MSNIAMYQDSRYKNVIKRRILKELCSYSSIRIINEFFYEENKVMLLKYSQIISKILEIDYPVSITVDNFFMLVSAIRELYKSNDNIRWLLASYDGSGWWIEIEIIELESFLKEKYEKDNYQFLVIDRINEFVLDVDLSEKKQYELRIIKTNS